MTPEMTQLQQRLAQTPHDPELHYELGRCYLALKQAEPAQQHFAQALALVPDHPQILMQLGNVASVQGQEGKAADFFRQSLVQDPQQADVHFNLANSLRKLGLAAEAIKHYQYSLKLDPNDSECHNNLGNAYRELGQLDLAVASYEQALQRNPQLWHALVHWIHQKQHMADWRRLDTAIAQVRQALSTAAQAQIPPFAFLAMPGTSDTEHLACSSAWANQHYAHIQPLPAPAARASGSRIKLAYVSSDFRRHPLAYLVTEVIAAHNRSQFEVWLFAHGKDDGSPERAAFVQAADSFVDISQMTDAQVATQMRAQGVDLMIDLTGYTQHSRSGIAAYRPARRHINWLGYPGSMGTLHAKPLFDAIIVDETLSEVALAEEKIMLPCYQPNNAARPTADAGSRADHGLPAQAFVFSCLNQSFKITPEVFAVWMRILQQVPHSVLWLLDCNPWATRNLLAHARGAGIGADRLIFAPRTGIANHIARQQHVDLMLDTAPYNAHTTASDALWQGIPLLTVEGQTFPSRVSASLLKRIGMPECVCADLAVLQTLAVTLANDQEKFQGLKQRLKTQVSPLFSPAAFCQALEAAYRQQLGL